MPLILGSIIFRNLVATTAPFFLSGGTYMLVVTAVWGHPAGEVGVQIECLDTGTFVPVHKAIQQNSAIIFDCPLGRYRLVITGATDVNAEFARIPLETNT